MTPADESTVYIETYGCQMNVSDSELMLGKLRYPTLPTSFSSTRARYVTTPSSG
jgi:tRNA A37 methylthiotransferase MiaB